VRILINYESRLIAIVKSNKEEEGATSFLSPTKKVISVRWNNNDLLNSLCELMDWDTDTYTYRVNAVFDKDQGVLLFDLNEAKKQ
jgi:hypothetical protein